MGTLLVVVIAGVIIAAIAGATLSGDPQPATAPGRPRRGRGRRRPGRRRGEPPAAPRELAAPLDDDPAPRALPGEPDVRPRWHRIRSAVLLVVTVVLLGSLAAGLLGLAIVVGYRVLDRALG